MLQPEYLISVSDPVVEIYAQVEQDITDDICRRIVQNGYLTDTAAYQIRKARAFGMLQGDVTDILATATGKSKVEIVNILKEAGFEALANDNIIYEAAGITTTSLNKSPALMSVILQGADTTNAVISNFTKTTSQTAPAVFTSVLDRAYLQIQSGAFSHTQAIQAAIRDLARKGIYQVAYENGITGSRSYTSVEAAVRRAVTTGVNQSCAKLTLVRAAEVGCNHVQVTAHIGARPSHAVWQGEVYCLEDRKDSDYPNFYDATGYGTGEGLCGWNCRHSFFPWFEGISSLPSWKNVTGISLEENEEVYELQQKQRYYERQVRAAKKEVSAYNAAAEAATGEIKDAILSDFQRASVKLKDREHRLQLFIDQHDILSRKRNREFTGNWNRSVSAKAVWANRKARK